MAVAPGESIVGCRVVARFFENRVARELVFAAGYLIAAVVLTFSFVRNPVGLGSNPRAAFPNVIDGTAYLPYANRALMPFLVRTIDGFLSDETRARISANITDGSLVGRALDEVDPEREPGREVQWIVCIGLIYLALIGFLYALRFLWSGVVIGPPLVGAIVPVVAIVSLPPFFREYASYMCDFPALLLFTLGLGFIARRWFVAFLVTFAVATVNKETAILLTAVFCLYFATRGDTNRGRFLALVAAQLAIFASIKLGLHSVFGDNPGTQAEFRLLRNVIRLPNYRLGSLFGGLVLVGLVLHQWWSIPLLLRCSLVMIVPLLGLTFLFGYFDEIRDYYEVFPALVLTLVLFGCRLAGIEVRDAAR